jgi:hypothetical protein
MLKQQASNAGEVSPEERKERLDAAFKGTGPAKLRALLAGQPKKRTSITIRVTPEDRDSINETAKSLDLSVARYILALHYMAAEKLRKGE